MLFFCYEKRHVLVCRYNYPKVWGFFYIWWIFYLIVYDAAWFVGSPLRSTTFKFESPTSSVLFKEPDLAAASWLHETCAKNANQIWIDGEFGREVNIDVTSGSYWVFEPNIDSQLWIDSYLTALIKIERHIFETAQPVDIIKGQAWRVSNHKAVLVGGLRAKAALKSRFYWIFEAINSEFERWDSVLVCV